MMHYVKAKGILSPKNGMNICRGCLHGCIYCDSRSRCYNMSHDFEDIEVKENAIELLENSLKHKRKKCMIGTGAMSDPYMLPEYMRKVLKLVYKYGFGITILTKSDRVLADLDLIEKINAKTKCVVQMTLTTFDENMCKKIEPNVCGTKARFEALKAFGDRNIPTVVWLCPLLPFINDSKENLEGILNYCIEAKVYGIICYGVGLTLREGNREYFYRCLDRDFPGMKEKYIKSYGNQYICNSPNNAELMRLFHEICKKNGIVHDNGKIFEYLSTFEEKDRQISLF